MIKGILARIIMTSPPIVLVKGIFGQNYHDIASDSFG